MSKNQFTGTATQPQCNANSVNLIRTSTVSIVFYIGPNKLIRMLWWYLRGFFVCIFFVLLFLHFHCQIKVSYFWATITFNTIVDTSFQKENKKKTLKFVKLWFLATFRC